MIDTFITKIHIDKVRYLAGFDILLSETERRHLILTGKNGSGKTSLLEAMRDYIVNHQFLDNRIQYNSNTPAAIQERRAINQAYVRINLEAMDVSVDFYKHDNNLYDTTFAYLQAARSSLSVPKSIEPIESWGNTFILRNASKDFLKFILNMYVQYLSAKDTGKTKMEIERYQAWFERFTQALRDIYGCQELELKPDMKNLAFYIDMPEREPFQLHEMSDGYQAFLEIYMEIIMRFNSDTENGTVDYNKTAIVFIDEIETHLHVELQKRALPFLTHMFPNVQFVVATHSPFVITSLPNAVVYDLEKHEQLDNPSFYSYEAVVESFLDADMYSDVMKQRFSRYKELCFKADKTKAENEEFLRTRTELELMSPASKELFIAFRKLEQERKEAKIGQTD